MISHLRALSAIQFLRCALGLAIGSFLIHRSRTVPYGRLDKLEPGDQAIFLVLGCLWLVLAMLRGVQGSSMLGEIRMYRKGAAAPGGVRPLLRLGSWLLWLLGGFAILGLWILAGSAQGWLETSGMDRAPWFPWLLDLLALRLPILLAWGGAGAVLLVRTWLPPGRKVLRRLGVVLAVVDLVDLAGFPFTTGCGTYGVVVLRHPEVREFAAK